MLEFSRVLSVIDNVARFLEYKYGVPFDYSQAKGIDFLVEEAESYNSIQTNEEYSEEQRNKKLFHVIKDYVRHHSELFQKVIDEDGTKKKMWFSPYFNKIVFDEIEELGLVSTFADENSEDLKEVFYKHKHLFELNDKEALFIDLCFSGYNPYNNIDVIVFQEALETDSAKYVKTFFNRLCEKLRLKSLVVGLR